MSYPSLAVIGTAGRKEDRTYLTMQHYDRMVQATMRLLDHLKVDLDTLKTYSGGAAWSDHVVVSLVLLGLTKAHNTTIFMPTAIGEDGFYGQDEKSSKTAGTANYYHKVFSDQIVTPSIGQLLALQDMGGNLIAGSGNFFQRNSDVAKAVSPDGILLAFTFGSPESDQPDWSLRSFSGDTKAKDAGLKDGGTADTFNKATCLKWHGRIGKDS